MKRDRETEYTFYSKPFRIPFWKLNGQHGNESKGPHVGVEKACRGCERPWALQGLSSNCSDSVEKLGGDIDGVSPTKCFCDLKYGLV